MHESSYLKMEKFVKKYLLDRKDESIKILDIGSCDVNGTYKPLFNNERWKYDGMDIEAGKNVDLVVGSNYNWKKIKSNTYDVVVSGQAFEHIEFFWITMFEIKRVLKNSALCCIIAPSAGIEHRHPVDCWRFYPDGFRALLKYVGMKEVEIEADFNPLDYGDGSFLWKDCLLICKKPELTFIGNLKFRIKHWMNKILANV